MSNEEILEEIYFDVRKNNVLDEFSDEVNKVIKSTNQRTLYDIVSEIYYNFISKGLIKNQSNS